MSWMLEEINRGGGAIRFDRFMELALYHPRHGYYAAERPRYGRSGDFLTAPTASDWYASVVARWCSRIACSHGPLRFCDLASGDGSFIAALRTADRENAIGSFVSIERSTSMRQCQEERFEAADVEILGEIDDLGTRGDGRLTIMHASELFDALPVRRVMLNEGRLQEFWVGLEDGELAWTWRPADSTTTRYLSGHGVELVEGQIAEINRLAEPLARQIITKAGPKSIVLVLDYGYESRRLYNPRGRLQGSLACYREHRLSRDPLEDPGAVDITAHVNWDDLRRAAAAGGFAEIGLWPLAEFLMRAGLPDEIESRSLGMEAELDRRVVGERQEIKRLLDPEGMGSDLKVLIQAGPDMAPSVAASLSID